MDDTNLFNQERITELTAQCKSESLKDISTKWLNIATEYKYSYHFDFFGLPIIQYPQDIVAVQEIIWKVKPDLIIETGVARGGSLIFSAAMLSLLDLCDGNNPFENEATSRKVLGIDIDIRAHNRKRIEQHPLSKKIVLLQGSSVSEGIVSEVKIISKKYERILVLLDSNHTHDHVLKELQLYSDLVSEGSYCVVFDTIIQNQEDDTYPDRPWGKNNNPMSAVHEFLAVDKRFEIDKDIDAKLQISVAPNGYLKRK
jgi:cephalosporin hydroxylase